MKRISISAIMKDDEIEKFYFVGQKDNGFEVEGYFSLEELKNVISKVEKTQSFEEQKNIIINEKIKEEITKDVENIKKYKDLIERWKIKTKYAIDEICKYNDIVFKCVKEHISEYESIPFNNTEFWKKLEEEKQVEDGANPEWQENFEKAEFYSRDKTYRQGEYVKYYNELYKAKKDIKNEQIPSSISEYWEHIPKNK